MDNGDIVQSMCIMMVTR